MEKLERDFALGKIDAAAYFEARTGRKCSTKSVRDKSGYAKLSKADCAALAGLGEFLKHAGPPPKVSAPSLQGEGK